MCLQSKCNLSQSVSTLRNGLWAFSAKVSYFVGGQGRPYKPGGGFLSPGGRHCQLPVSVGKAETGMQIPSRHITSPNMMTLDAGNAHALASLSEDAAEARLSQVDDDPLSVKSLFSRVRHTADVRGSQCRVSLLDGVLGL